MQIKGAQMMAKGARVGEKPGLGRGLREGWRGRVRPTPVDRAAPRQADFRDLYFGLGVPL